MSIQSDNNKLSKHAADVIFASHRRSVASHLVRRLAIMSEYRLHNNAQHIKRILAFTYLTAKALGLDETQARDIAEASQLHDIGMITIPDKILLKPRKLSASERAIMEKHTVTGTRLLGRYPSGMLRIARTIIQSHHEQWDGSGYPNGLAGEDIPIEGRIVALTDTFDALQSTRPHRKAISSLMAITLLEQGGNNGHFDPAVIAAFLSTRAAVLEICQRLPPR